MKKYKQLKKCNKRQVKIITALQLRLNDALNDVNNISDEHDSLVEKYRCLKGRIAVLVAIQPDTENGY